MYNDEKKLITDIKRHKELDKNLAVFADKVYSADFEYACHKFTLNYFTVKEMIEDKEIADDPYIYECITGINKLTGIYISGDATECSDNDRQLINNMRDTVTRKMKILTSYTDAFELYEYILNRKEYNFPENENPDVEMAFADYDADTFSAEIFNFIFADKDKVAINAKIQSMIGQLPLRMTKSKFYDILGQTLTIYNGLEKGAVNEFAETVATTALLTLPEGFDTEYTGLYEALSILKEADYSELDFESYKKLMDVIERSAAFINDVVSDYMMVMELINDLYVMMLSCKVKDNISDGCRRAVKVISGIHEAIADDSAITADVYDLLMSVEGYQEAAGEHRIMLESAVFDINNSFSDDIVRTGMEDIYRVIDIMDRLLSGSLFVDIENISMYDTTPADSEYIISVRDKLVNEFAKLFSENKMLFNRAVMAKILASIPVFFNSQQEIKDYVEYSLNHCSNISEVKASYIVIKQMMEE
ncbi:MAG: hypothetical protein ACI4EF_04645 [Coprococcus sp.]